MGQERSKVTVVIAVRNGDSFLGEAIESVLRQDHQPLELIVVDDGSSDRSTQVASSFDQVRLIERPPQGVSAARNVAVTATSGAFISFLDADDIWVEQKLSKQVNLLERHPEIDCVFGHMKNFLQPGSSKPGWLRHEIGEVVKGHSLCTMMVRRHEFERVGLFDEELVSGSDSDWFFRARDAGIRSVMVSDLFLLRRIHENNLSHQAEISRAGILASVRDSIARKKDLRKGKHSIRE